MYQNSREMKVIIDILTWTPGLAMWTETKNENRQPQANANSPTYSICFTRNFKMKELLTWHFSCEQVSIYSLTYFLSSNANIPQAWKLKTIAMSCVQQFVHCTGVHSSDLCPPTISQPQPRAGDWAQARPPQSQMTRKQTSEGGAASGACRL